MSWPDGGPLEGLRSVGQGVILGDEVGPRLGVGGQGLRRRRVVRLGGSRNFPCIRISLRVNALRSI